ncbi:hypothetical protein EYZ11_005618 [Aspergillus tanneri]|uniref:Zinc finger C2H2 LYAR-type domain-containing protein n=1 Tax=Aspergillus tanneri TaxID=1220188 RepID=A0A4S3JHH2_9EURO|nr:uncharacterized protein ATNIH1004_011019 [Aspergillus tanneri]KAA8642078.1 hypothetical protein ATNIH1004_011019 [Aspergillus tanneri]THC94896.1 hypothetical protein EYZ11_005618 [Aspergillus tanneri]
MVSFSCEACGDILTKKKLDPHRNQCRGASFTCIDCMVHFQGTQYRSHTSCMTEAQKYQGALYKEKPSKNQRKGNQKQNQNLNANSHRAPYVEDVPDVDNPKAKANAPPPAPTPPPVGAVKPSSNATKVNNDKQVNVFDFLVTENTPNASKVSIAAPKEQMQMVEHAPSVFEPSKALAHLDTEIEDENKSYDVAYEENGFSYGTGPIPPSVYPNKAPNVSMEFMTPAPKKKKDRSRAANGQGSATTSDKKRKRRTEDHDMEDVDTPMMDAPSSVVNNPPTPMLNHSGLTGGLNRMLRSPSLDEDYDHTQRRYQDPSSPIKRTRRDEKDETGLGISIKNRAERLVSSMFGGSSVSAGSGSGHEPSAKALVRTHRRSSSDDGNNNQLDIRRSKKTHRVRDPSTGQVISSDPRKTKRKSSAQTNPDRPSRRLKQIDYPNPSQPQSPRGHDGQVVVYQQPNVPDELQREMAAHFLSLVTKGPESGRGFSVNKVLKRFHRDFTDEFDGDRGRDQGRSRADRERRGDDEKDLWRTLRLKQNDRGEVVVFF